MPNSASILTTPAMQNDVVTDMLDLPLSGIVVIDIVRGPLAPITRYLAELGARVERLDGGQEDIDLFEDFAANAIKRRHGITAEHPDAAQMIADAHVIVASRGAPIDLSALAIARPSLVTMTVSNFGSNTGLTEWKGSGPVLHALSGELARSGLRGREPLLPPGDLAYQCAAAQAAFTLIAALYRALRTGIGDHFDFAALDGAVQALDPGFGIGGSATMGKPAKLLSRDRPVKGFQYPIFPCADGHVRLCLLAKRQWQGMFRWMGEPAQFSSPEYDKLLVRYKSPDLLPAIGAFFADKTRAEIEEGSIAFGVPVSAILAFEECVATDHHRERNAITPLRMPDGRVANLPNGVMCIDGYRAGHARGTLGNLSFPAKPIPETQTLRPFDGLRVLDLGVIVVGAEQARLLADQGADVVKVESSAYPDGNRQSYLPYGMSVSFAAGHRNKRSLNINLRTEEGRRLFLDLAAQADIIMSNFKPGTLESLGLAYREVIAVNPAIVMVDSSAFGPTGPWSGRMGYGPLVRAATGLTLAWRYPDDPESFSDSLTIYPDHVAGRVGAMGAVALLIRRLRTGRGGTISVAQSEVMLSHFGPELARLSAGESAWRAPDYPYGVYPVLGEDEWCVVTIDGATAWRSFCELVGFAHGAALDTPDRRLQAKAEIDEILLDWLATRSPFEAARALQAVGIAAAPMLRVSDLPDFEYFKSRKFFRTEEHPFLQEDVIAERWHAKGENTLDAETRSAPLSGEHSKGILVDWLGMTDTAIEGLLRSEVIALVDPSEREAIEKAGLGKGG